VEDVSTPEELLMHCMPAFGAAYVRRIFAILDQAIASGVPLVMAVAGPVTVSDQHRCWMIPLLQTGWFAYITVTDATCYHDGHDCLAKTDARPIFEVPIEGHDLELRRRGVIRITNTGFSEDILYDQDDFITDLLRRPEFQRKMSGTEYRWLLGRAYGEAEKKFDVRPGLLSTCHQLDIPVFVGAPGDGSTFLNSVKLQLFAQIGNTPEHKFGIDIHAEVIESCAYHLWGLTKSEAKQLGILILGGGVPKNFSLQPEPALSQIFGLPDIRGYDYDVQIVSAPVEEGSLSSCKPDEAHTWGKVSEEALGKTVESYQADYSTLMPLIAWALLDKRRRLQDMAAKMDERMLYDLHPEARGYLRSEQYRLFAKRDELMSNLHTAIAEQSPMLPR
jgi:deoxyhypusine synthase